MLGQDKLGHQLPHCTKHMEERPLTHTSCISGGADAGSEFPNHTEAGGTSEANTCINPSHHLVLKAKVP